MCALLYLPLYPFFGPVHISAAELLYEDKAADMLERTNQIRLITRNLWTGKDISDLFAGPC
jgi:hypothetical protein